jgi:hypothetical protein
MEVAFPRCADNAAPEGAVRSECDRGVFVVAQQRDPEGPLLCLVRRERVIHVRPSGLRDRHRQLARGIVLQLDVAEL